MPLSLQLVICVYLAALRNILRTSVHAKRALKQFEVLSHVLRFRVAACQSDLVD